MITQTALALILSCASVDRNLPYSELSLQPTSAGRLRLELDIYRLLSYDHYWTEDLEVQDLDGGGHTIRYADGEATVTRLADDTGYRVMLEHIEEGGYVYRDLLVCPD